MTDLIILLSLYGLVYIVDKVYTYLNVKFDEKQIEILNNDYEDL